jgi:hypothetical protein
VPLLPLFLARLTLGYFPALFGHAFDALVLAWLLARRGSLTSRGSWLSLAALLALAFLAYTQSALNLLIVFGLFCAIDLARERSRAALSRTLALALAFGLAGVIAFGAFYFRYLPMLDAMRSGQPVPQERVLLERLEREEKARVAIGEPAHVEEADPYTVAGLRSVPRLAEGRLAALRVLRRVRGARRVGLREAGALAAERPRAYRGRVGPDVRRSQPVVGEPSRPEPRPLQQGSRDRRPARLPLARERRVPTPRSVRSRYAGRLLSCSRSPGLRSASVARPSRSERASRSNADGHSPRFNCSRIA